MKLLARPSIELVTVDSAITKKAEQQIESCEHCRPADAEIPFDWLLAEVTGRRGTVDVVLTESARCPNCKQPIRKDVGRTRGRLLETYSPNEYYRSLGDFHF